MSGGTTPVINSTLAGVLSFLLREGPKYKLYTAPNGIEGVIKGQFNEINKNKEFINKAYKEPGSAITGTSRIGLLNEESLNLIDREFKRMQFDFLINVGGNGTLQQSRHLSQYFGEKYLIANCPKTVDNDLGDSEMEDVFFTPGFPSCINWWNKMLNFFNIENKGAASHDKVLVLQTFGRETGFISGAIGKNTIHEDYIVNMIPESSLTKEDYLELILKKIKIFERCIVIISEGHFSKELQYNFDPVGQVQFSSGKTTSAQIFVDYLLKKGINSRCVIPGTMQRVFEKEVLDFDRELAFTQGYECINQINKGKRNFLMTISKNIGDELPILGSINFKNKEKYSRKMSYNFFEDFGSENKYSEYLKKINLTKDLFKDFVNSKLEF